MKYYYLTLLSILLLSCNPNEDDVNFNTLTETNLTEGPLPTSLTSVNETKNLIYDDQNRLINFYETSTNNSYSKSYTFVHSTNTLTQVIEEFESSDLYAYTKEYSFEYINNTVNISINYLDNIGYTKTETRNIKIDESGYLINGYGILTTYDSAKNLTNIVSDNTTSIISYDNQNSIFKNVNTPQWVIHLILPDYQYVINNPIIINLTKIESGETFSTNFTYEYNSSGYPTKKFITDYGNQTTEIQIEYN